MIRPRDNAVVLFELFKVMVCDRFLVNHQYQSFDLRFVSPMIYSKFTFSVPTDGSQSNRNEIQHDIDECKRSLVGNKIVDGD